MASTESWVWSVGFTYHSASSCRRVGIDSSAAGRDDHAVTLSCGLHGNDTVSHVPEHPFGGPGRAGPRTHRPPATRRRAAQARAPAARASAPRPDAPASRRLPHPYLKRRRSRFCSAALRRGMTTYLPCGCRFRTRRRYPLAKLRDRRRHSGTRTGGSAPGRALSQTLLVPCLDMTYQVHRIMQQPENVNHGLFFKSADPVQHEVPAFPTPARHMQSHQAFRDFIPSSRSGNLRPRCQRFDRPRQGLGILARLCLSEPFRRPTNNISEIDFGGGCQTDAPTATVGNHDLSVSGETVPSVSVARADKSSRSASAASNVR